MAVPPDRRRKRRDYSKPHRLFVEDTPVEVRAILEEAAALEAIIPVKPEREKRARKRLGSPADGIGPS